MTALPMTLRVDRFAERHPRSGHQSQIVIATCRVIHAVVINRRLSSRLVVQLFNNYLITKQPTRFAYGVVPFRTRAVVYANDLDVSGQMNLTYPVAELINKLS